jgi:hypothetical protein
LLSPTRAKNEFVTVDFQGALLIAVRGKTPAETLVAIKPVLEGMGLDWEKQRRRLHLNPVLEPDITFRTVQMPGTEQGREWIFLPLTRLNFWLATVQANKVPDHSVRERVIQYQKLDIRASQHTGPVRQEPDGW